MRTTDQSRSTLSVILQPVSLADRDHFMAMAEQHFRGLNAGFVPQEDWERYYLDNILRNPRLFLRWIMVEGKRVGFILFGLEDHRFLPRQTGAIYELYVVPEFRRKGVARTCAHQAIAELQAQSPSKVQLEVMEGNQGAAALWKSLGFEKVSERFVLRRTVG